MCKKKSLFNDPAEQIQELVYVIKQDLTNLNASITRLNDFKESGRSAFIKNNNQTRQHSTNVVKALRSSLAKTTKRFKEVLSMRSNVRRRTPPVVAGRWHRVGIRM